ncbi:MAG: tRNA (adenosine(37)-N6)-threonylcarbamoyltransferase complex ATPase subunit type 1 TsaE [bacterium]|nr:tRNA (adenosine(37)-N6)-threonylcarbamoyltransferase complex ATPase subunit type 1 TsaE [bacterium]
MITNSYEETKEFAKEILSKLPVSSKGATVVLLEGDLGVGKTTFVQGLASALGVSQPTTSPTFVLEKIYRLPSKSAGGVSGFTEMVHIDAYRLEGEDSREALGLDALLMKPHTLVVIEWPEHIIGELPESAVRALFAHQGGDKRSITIAFR